MNKEGLAHYSRGDWAKAVERFKEAIKKWPENNEFKANLTKAENEWQQERDRQARKDLNDALKEQERIEASKNLNEALKEQERREFLGNLNDALKEQEKTLALNNLKKDFEKQELIKEQKERIADLLQKMKTEQQAIRTLGLYDPRDPEKRARDFEEWEKLADQARIEFEKELLDSILVALEVAVAESIVYGAGKAAKPIKSLDLANVNAQIAWLQSKGITDPYLFEAMRAVAKTPGKQETAKRLLDRLHIATRGVELSISPDLRAGPRENDAEKGYEQMDGLSMVLTVIHPKFKALAADFRFTASSLYNNITRRVSQSQIDSLTKLTEDQLKLLKKYNERLRELGKQLIGAREELARLSEGN